MMNPFQKVAVYVHGQNMSNYVYFYAEVLEKIITGTRVHVEFPSENDQSARMMTMLRGCLSLEIHERPTIKHLTVGINEISPL